MAGRLKFSWRWLFFLTLLIALLAVGIATDLFSVAISEFNSLGIGDRATLVIATVASCALFISIWQSGYSVVVNNRNNRLAKEQREQSAIENKRTYDLMLLQMNRANRLKLYVPLLAWMRGMWYDFEEGVKSIPPRVDELRPIFETHASNLEALKRLIVTFEFEAEMDLIANQTVQDATLEWKDKMIAAGELLEELNSKIDSLESDPSALEAFSDEQASIKKELERRSFELIRDLQALEELIRLEIEITKG